MSDYIFTCQKVKHGKKEHVCCLCNKPILIGEPSLIVKSIYEGNFFTDRYHSPCSYSLELANDLDYATEAYSELFRGNHE